MKLNSRNRQWYCSETRFSKVTLILSIAAPLVMMFAASSALCAGVGGRFARSDEDSDPGRRVNLRYGNPALGRFVAGVSTDQSLRLYMEVSRLIDSRHLQPVSYTARVRRSLQNLAIAISNPEFQRTYHVSPASGQVAAFRGSLNQLATARPVRNSSDALRMLYWTIDLARRHLSLPPKAVALEFVYAAAEAHDKYSAFEPNDRPSRPSASLDDHVVGIGVEIKVHDNGVEIVRALRGGPAAQAGLRTSDVILSVNGQSLSGRNMNQIVDLIAGPAGSPVLLSVKRKGYKKGLVTLVRRRVELHSVSEARLLPGKSKVAYIKLEKFTAKSEQEMDEALWRLYRQGMQALVIDVRGNPGGLLTTATALSDKFLPCGAIVSTRGRTAGDNSVENASFEKTWRIPLVVLVDKNSASASEIFAAAIQENQRGLVVGTRSYGKGTVQTHFPLQSVSGNLRLTTAKFYSPQGREMSGAGVTPDVQINEVELISNDASVADKALQSAMTVAVSSRVKQMAETKSGCRNRPAVGLFRSR